MFEGRAKLIYMLRALCSGASWRSQAIYEFGTYGIDPGSAFQFASLMDAISQQRPHVAILSPTSSVITVDELNLLSLLRRAAKERSVSDDASDLGFSMPTELRGLLDLCGAALFQASFKFQSRPMLSDGWDGAGRAETPSQSGVDAARRIRRATIQSITERSPGMLRMTLSGADLKTMNVSSPAMWVKLFPGHDGSPDSAAPIGRAYTIRKHEVEQGRITIDVSLDSGGMLATWAKLAYVGDLCGVAGPRGGFDAFPSDCETLLVAGDMSGVPAIEAIVESAPEHVEVQAFVVAKPEDCNLEIRLGGNRIIRWVDPGNDPTIANHLLRDAVVAQVAFRRSAYVWAAGEASLIRELRRGLITSLQVNPRRITTTGYWKRGERDYRDAAAG
ncbi:hypothetical protein WM40_26210 [Robbsia andropogonis]|uniref:FAD-binding FR-type domain-containing protein n=2 Tax=Robbsia andropogonis TaxID=28092 RepID=A0A0F5JUB8_9BURK|nr:hypothetical protein WM40_26210 [Robbsia andropogonis]